MNGFGSCRRDLTSVPKKRSGITNAFPQIHFRPPLPFLDAFSDFYERVCPSVRPSVRPVCPSIRQERDQILTKEHQNHKTMPHNELF